MLQTIIVSINVPVIETKPCRTGSLVRAAAAAIGALPSPDSLEKIPRAIPFCIAIIIAPNAPPAAASKPKALRKIKTITLGNFAAFKTISHKHKPTYKRIIAGTIISETLAIRLTPPIKTPATQIVTSKPEIITAQE